MHEILELANHYPSPHNGQPIRIKQLSDSDFELYFDRERGLQATDVSFIFSFVTIGVFMQHFDYACRALGHKITYALQLPGEEELHGSGVIKFATAHIEWNVSSPDEALRETLLFRQTSRRKYTHEPSEKLVATLATLTGKDMDIVGLDKKASTQAIWLNQRAVFDDMFDDAVRRELNHWLRYTKKEKEEKKDGLSYDCMQINGRAMKFSVDHYKILHAPLVSSLLRRYYLRTMKDKSRVFYMTAPLLTPQNAYDIGEAIMRIWKEVSEAREYLHPFGTIMSNHEAHQDFAKLVGLTDESREAKYLVFIFRLGSSKPPVRAERIPYQNHLKME